MGEVSIVQHSMMCTVEPRAANHPQPEAGLPQGKMDPSVPKRLTAYLRHLPSPTQRLPMQDLRTDLYRREPLMLGGRLRNGLPCGLFCS